MPDISIQFHSLPQELVELIRQFSDEAQPRLVSFCKRPFRSETFEVGLLDKIFEDPETWRVVFTAAAPILGGDSSLAFMDSNPDCLILEIGRLTEAGLGESWLSARTSDAATAARWQLLAKRLRQITKAGALAVNPDTGATSRLRNHRYTDGALRLAQANVPILPGAGGTLIRLPG